jgi:signal transduction histidine kinase
MQNKTSLLINILLLVFLIINFSKAREFRLNFYQNKLPDNIRLDKNINPDQLYFEQNSAFPNNEKTKQVLYLNIGSYPNQTDIDLFSVDLNNENIYLDSLTTFSWRWKIKNTKTADGIFIRFYSDKTFLFSIGSHSGYTFTDMLICNEKNGVWNEHKINFYDVFQKKINRNKLLNKKITKIKFVAVDALSQGLWLDYMMISRQPANQSDRVVNYYFINENKQEQIGRKPISACFVDIDRDNDQDIFIVNQDEPNYIRLNNGYGKYSAPVFLFKKERFIKNSYALFVDINDDGWRDIYEGRENADNLLFLNNGNLKFKFYKSFYDKEDCHTQTYATLWGDFDHNGCLDFIEIYPSFSTVDVSGERTNVCLASVNSTERKNIGFIAPYFGGSIADIDNDGNYELFLANNRGKNNLFKFTKDSSLEIVKDTIFQDIPFLNRMDNRNNGFGWSEGGVFLDIDNDADLDLYVCNDGDPNQLYIWDNNKYVEKAQIHNLDDSLESEGFLIADFDNDMDWDIYLLHTRKPNQLMLNNGKGYFYDGTTASGFEHPGGSVGGACADVDNDGDIDIYLVDPYKGEQLLINPLNNDNFFKLQLRGQSGNYYGIRAKLQIFKGNSTVKDSILLSHQITLGDGFQFDAFPGIFNFGLIPGSEYTLKVVFDDGLEVIRGIEAGKTNLIIHPASNIIADLFNNFLYRVREPLLMWLRTLPTVFIIVFLLLWAFVGNFFKQYIIQRKWLKHTVTSLMILLTALFMADLKTVRLWQIILILIFGSYFSEFIINPLRKFLNKYYAHESTWDRLFEHLKAFRHGGVAINNLDRIIFLFQNIYEFQGDFQIYQNRIADAVRTFNRQTSWQLSELIYILKDIHWERNKILLLKNSHKKLLRIFKKHLYRPNQELYFIYSVPVIKNVKNIEGSIDQIYKKVVNHFSCNSEEIISQTLKTKYPEINCRISNLLAEQKNVKIKGYELGNIIADLIENGLRSANGEKVFKGEIILQQQDTAVLIDVSDNGKGIARKYHKKIFEKGYTTRTTDGGFGLFYARETLQKYGGEIFVLRSEKEKGTTMRMVLRIVGSDKTVGGER